MRRARTLASAVVLVLAGCSSSPTEPEPALAVFEHSVPSSAQRGATVELVVGLRAVEATGSWEKGGLTVSIPGVFDPESLVLLEVEGDEARVTPAAPHGGGFDVIVVGGPFTPGDRLRVRLSMQVRPDAPTGTQRIQVDGVAFNEVADQRVRELGIVSIPVSITAS